METSANRLAGYRRSAFHYAERNGAGDHYRNWRAWVIRTQKTYSVCRDLKDPNIIYTDSLGTLGWRECGDAHSIITLRHTGWYASCDQHNMIVGCVLQLPARNGVEQYVPATYHSDYDTATISLNEVTSEKGDAARWADQNAEKEAEECREGDAKDAAEQQIAEARAEIHIVNRQVLPALKELKGARLTPALCSMVRGGISELLAERRAAFNTIKKLEDDFWQAVQ